MTCVKPWPVAQGSLKRLLAAAAKGGRSDSGTDPCGSRVREPGTGTGKRMRQVVVLGIGNTLLSDEGAGVHVLRRLQARGDDAHGAELIDGGTLSFTLAGPIEDCDALVVIDAAELGAAPGTVRVFEGEDMDRFLGASRKRSVHEVGLLDLMAVAALAGRLPERRALIGIQPHALGWGDVPSAPVASAIPRACDRTLELIARWRA